MRRTVGIGACSSVVLLAAACNKVEEAAATHQTPAVTASIDTVRLSTFAETLDGVGTVVPRIGRVALLAAPSPTRVTTIHVAVGDHVQTNTPLVDLEQPTFDAMVTSADAALRTAEQASARATRLVAVGVAPRKDAEFATAELAAAQLNALTARRARDLSHIRSPFAGVVTRLTAAVGASVDAGQPLVEITDPSVLDVVLPVSPAVAGRIRHGQRVDLLGGTGQDTARIGVSQVADVSAIVDSLSRSVSVRLTLLSSSRVLRIGETVFARVMVAQHGDAVVIPDDALVPSGEAFHVFIVDSAGLAHSREVTVGGRALHRVWITDGLVAGDRVVTKGAYGMDDGARVIAVKP